VSFVLAAQKDMSLSVMLPQVALIASVATGSQVQLPELHVNWGVDQGCDESLLNNAL
jgi:hypothetical protein